MNATYEQLSSADVAKILKVDKTTITGWCKQGCINFIDVSGPTSKYPRYVFEEDEIYEIKRLRSKYGKRRWFEHYNKDWKLKRKKKEEKEVQTYPWVLDVDVDKQEEQYPTVKAEPEKIVELSIAEPVIEEKKAEFNEDKLLNSILHIREVKEEIENCKARLAQLENEYKEYKQEILEWL